MGQRHLSRSSVLLGAFRGISGDAHAVVREGRPARLETNVRRRISRRAQSAGDGRTIAFRRAVPASELLVGAMDDIVPGSATWRP